VVFFSSISNFPELKLSRTQSASIEIQQQLQQHSLYQLIRRRLFVFSSAAKSKATTRKRSHHHHHHHHHNIIEFID